MKNLSAKIVCGVLAGVLCVGSFAGCAEKPIDGTAEAFTVNGESVNMGVANFVLRYQQAMMTSYYSMMGQDTSGIWAMSLGDGTYGETFKADTQDITAKMYLLRAHAADYDVVLTDEEIASADEAAEKFMAANDEATLTKLGVSKEDISTVLQLYTYQEKMYDPIVADIDREVSDEEAAQTTITFVKVSTDGTTDDDGNTVELTDEEKAAKLALAQQVLDAVLASEDAANADMGTIVEGIDESLSASSRSYGSDDTLLDETVKEKVKELTDGQVYAQVIEGADGAYYVLRLDKAFDEEKTATEKESIISEREQERYNEVVDGWLEEAKVKTTKAWDAIEVVDTDVYTYAQTETEEESDE